MSLKHHVIVTAPPKGSTVYYCSQDSYFPYYIFVDGYNRLVQPVIVYEGDFESLYSSPYRNIYHDRDCYHSSLTFRGMIGLDQLPGTTTLVEPANNYYTRLTTFANGMSVRVSIPRIGLIASDGMQENQVRCDADYFRKEYLKDGKLYYAFDRVLTSRRIYLQNSVWTCSRAWTFSRTCSKPALDKGFTNYTERHSDSFKAIKIGVFGDVVLPPTSYFANLFSGLHRSDVLHLETPSSFTDDLFGQLTIPNVNNVENLKDFREIKKSLIPIGRFLKRKSIKNFAGLYLWYKYTYSTTAMDLSAYYEFFQKWQKQSLSKEQVKRLHLTYAYQVDPLRLDKQSFSVRTDTYNCGVLQALGLEINLSNVWDTLPFSFIVDWFINVGDVLSRLDHTDTLSDMKIRSVISTIKSTILSQPLSSLNCDATCTSVLFQRTISGTLPVGKVSFSLKNPLNHIKEGTALVVANKN